MRSSFELTSRSIYGAHLRGMNGTGNQAGVSRLPETYAGRFRVESISEPSKLRVNSEERKDEFNGNEITTETTAAIDDTAVTINESSENHQKWKFSLTEALLLFGKDWNERGLRLFTLILFILILLAVLLYYIFQ